MNRLFRLGSLVILLTLFASILMPTLAQEAGSGAPIIEPNFGDDIKTLNPIIVNDGPSNDVIDRIFPKFIQYNTETIAWEAGVPRGLVESWTVSDDNLTYTFKLREDLFWSDGTQITSADIQWFWDAVASGETSTPRATLVDSVESLTTPDPQTVVITFRTGVCNAIDILAPIYPVPAHVFAETFGDDYAGMDDSDYNLNPSVSGSDFIFANFRPGEQVTTLANPDYPDAVYGSVIPEGWVFKTVTDQVVQMEQFFAGEITYIESVPDASKDEVRQRAETGEFQIFESPAGSIRFLSLNLADPAKPQNGLDENGDPIDQGLHPVLGDKRVRKALVYGMNYEEVNQGAFFGFGIQTVTHALPSNWAYPEGIEPLPFDPDMANDLLTEAGWTDTDNDGIRECHGCTTAEEGTPLAFTVQTNSGNTSQEALYTVLQDQWNELGFDVTVEFIDFNILIENFQAQTYDAVGIFWSFGTPDDPDGTTDVFAPIGDVLGSGFNTQSYNNPRVTELLNEARSLPGCDTEERKVKYQEVYEILADELPWIWISTTVVQQAAQGNVENWNPRLGGYHGARWNLDGWTISD